MAQVERTTPRISAAENLPDDVEVFEVMAPEAMADGSLMVPVFDPATEEYDREKYVPESWLVGARTAMQHKIQDLERLITTLRANTLRQPDFSIPCFFCYRFVREKEAFCMFACCSRVGHERCLLRTQYRNGSNLVEDLCPACHAEMQREKTEHLRAELIRLQKGEHDDARAIPPTPRGAVMLNVCIMCERLTERRLWLRTKSFTAQMVDEVYGEFQQITVKELHQHGVTVEKMRGAGMSLFHVVRCFRLTEEMMFDVVGKGVANVGFCKRDLKAHETEVAALLEAGIDAKALRRRRLDLSDLKHSGLGAEALNILGFTAIDLVAMGMQKGVISNFVSFSIADWFDLLGLDRVTVYMLGLNESDFAEGGVLRGWTKHAVASSLALRDDEVSTYIAPSKKNTKIGKTRHVLE